MDHYLDIELRLDPEFPTPQLMNALLANLHRALVRQGAGLIGISFPMVDAQAPRLGNRLRMHGGRAALHALQASNWLNGMYDHVNIGPIASVPAEVQYRVVRRVQAHSSPERMRRRLMRREQLSEEHAALRIPYSSSRQLRLPYAQLRSNSTSQNFRLFIEHGPLQPNATAGEFSAYGLSQTGTVPWF